MEFSTHSGSNRYGKHIRIQKLKNSGSFYYNYKQTYSIILVAITGLEYNCLYADVFEIKAFYYKGHKMDQLSSLMMQKLSNGEITFYVFLEDDAFTLKSFMMKPLLQ